MLVITTGYPKKISNVIKAPAGHPPYPWITMDPGLLLLVGVLPNEPGPPPKRAGELGGI